MQLQQNSALFKSISYLQKSSKNQMKVINPKPKETNESSVPNMRSAIDSAYISQQLQYEIHTDQTTSIYNPIQHSNGDKAADLKPFPIPSSVGGAIAATKFQSRQETKTYQVMIKNNKFNPDNLKIEKGSIVEFKVCEDSKQEESDFSLYSSSSRGHVIAFENLQTESQRLKLGESFRVRFLESGHFNYKCSIHTRMTGLIQVYDFLTKGNIIRDMNKVQKQAVGGINAPSKDQNCIFRTEKTNSELSQRLIEVLEEEKQLDENNAPFIDRKYFKEVFEKQFHKLKCEVELTSDDQLERASEDQEEQEKEEKIFLEEQRNSSKNSKGSSQKQSSQPSHKDSSESDTLPATITTDQLDLSGEGEQNPTLHKILTPFSMLYHTERSDLLEKEYIENYSIKVLDFNSENKSTASTEIELQPVQKIQEKPKQQEQIPEPKKALFVIRTLEPDKQGGRKPLSKEFLIQSNSLVQDDPYRAREEEKLMQNQQKKDKKKNKKKEYIKKKKAKIQDNSKPNEFDTQLVQAKVDGIFTKLNYGQRISKNCRRDPEYLTDQLNYMQKQFDIANKNCVSL